MASGGCRGTSYVRTGVRRHRCTILPRQPSGLLPSAGGAEALMNASGFRARMMASRACGEPGRLPGRSLERAAAAFVAIPHSAAIQDSAAIQATRLQTEAGIVSGRRVPGASRPFCLQARIVPCERFPGSGMTIVFDRSAWKAARPLPHGMAGPNAPWPRFNVRALTFFCRSLLPGLNVVFAPGDRAGNSQCC